MNNQNILDSIDEELGASETEQRIAGLQIARRHTNDLVLEHMEVYFRALATNPSNPVEAFSIANLITQDEIDYMNRYFCADCECFNDILNVRNAFRIEELTLLAQNEQDTKQTPNKERK